MKWRTMAILVLQAFSATASNPAIITIACSPESCRATPERLDSWPAEIAIRVEEKWRCSIPGPPDMDCAGVKAPPRNAPGGVEVQLSSTVSKLRFSVRIPASGIKPPEGSATVRVSCDAAGCTPSLGTLPSLPAEWNIQLSEPWICKIELGIVQWSCAQKKQVASRNRGVLRLRLISLADARRAVELPVSEPQTEAGLLLPTLAATSSVVALLAGVLGLAAASGAAKGREEREVRFACLVREHYALVSDSLTALRGVSRGVNGGDVGWPSTPTFEAAEAAHGRHIDEGILTAIRAARHCLKAMDSKSTGMEEAIARLQKLASIAGGGQRLAQRRDALEALAKLAITELDSIVQPGGSMPDAEEALMELLNIGGMAVFVPEPLDLWDPNSQEPESPSEVTAKADRDGRVAEVKVRGLADRATGRIVAKAAVVLYTRA